MRKFFYGIGVFAFLCILSLGYYSTYRIADMQKEMSRMEQAMGGQEAQAAQLPKTANTANTKSTKENTVPDDGDEARSASSQEGGYGLYYLKAPEGYVMVYEGDRTTLYEPTGIALASLPEKLQREILQGKYLKDKEELYGFLENYSS